MGWNGGSSCKGGAWRWWWEEEGKGEARRNKAAPLLPPPTPVDSSDDAANNRSSEASAPAKATRAAAGMRSLYYWGEGWGVIVRLVCGGKERPKRRGAGRKSNTILNRLPTGGRTGGERGQN